MKNNITTIQIETEDGLIEVAPPVLEDDAIFFNGEIIKIDKKDLETYIDPQYQNIPIDQLLAKKQLEFEQSAKQRDAKRLEELKSAAAKHKKLVNERIKFFSPDFGLELHDRSFVVIGAATGHGKSTFTKQSAAYAIMCRQKVLIISNELPAAAYYQSIADKLSSMAGISFDDAFEKVFNFLIVEDMHTSKGMTMGWMTCVKYTFTNIKKHNPDLVFIDQLSNATRDTGYEGKRVDSYKKFEIMAADLGNRINTDGDERIPPIVTFQQIIAPPHAQKSIAWDLKSCLRDSKNTLNYATHGLMIVKKSDGEGNYLTVIKIDKCRYEYTYGKPITQWTMNSNWVLIPKAEDEN